MSSADHNSRSMENGTRRVEVDRSRCQGHNRCVALCPDVFEPDEFGYSVVRLPEVGREFEERVLMAERNCPENAISVS